MKGLIPASAPGRSATIFHHPTQAVIFKQQCLIRVPDSRTGKSEYYSVQINDPDSSAHRDNLVALFTTGKVSAKSRLAAKRRLANVAKVSAETATHSFAAEIAALEAASEAGVSPRLLDWWIVDTGHGVALGVYKQEKAPRGLDALTPCELSHYMITKGCRPFVELIRACARAGVAHLDLNPSNIVLIDDSPQLIDFGLSIAFNPWGFSRPLCEAYFYYTMIKSFAQTTHVRDSGTVFMCGCEVPVTSDDYAVLSHDFFPRLATEVRQSFLRFYQLWKAEHTGDIPGTPGPSWVFAQTRDAVADGVGEAGERLLNMRKNTRIIATE